MYIWVGISMGYKTSAQISKTTYVGYFLTQHTQTLAYLGLKKGNEAWEVQLVLSTISIKKHLNHFVSCTTHLLLQEPAKIGRNDQHQCNQFENGKAIQQLPEYTFVIQNIHIMTSWTLNNKHFEIYLSRWCVLIFLLVRQCSRILWLLAAVELLYSLPVAMVYYKCYTLYRYSLPTTCFLVQSLQPHKTS